LNKRRGSPQLPSPCPQPLGVVYRALLLFFLCAGVLLIVVLIRPYGTGGGSRTGTARVGSQHLCAATGGGSRGDTRGRCCKCAGATSCSSRATTSQSSTIASSGLFTVQVSDRLLVAPRRARYGMGRGFDRVHSRRGPGDGTTGVTLLVVSLVKLSPPSAPIPIVMGLVVEATTVVNMSDLLDTNRCNDLIRRRGRRSISVVIGAVEVVPQYGRCRTLEHPSRKRHRIPGS